MQRAEDKRSDALLLKPFSFENKRDEVPFCDFVIIVHFSEVDC